MVAAVSDNPLDNSLDNLIDNLSGFGRAVKEQARPLFMGISANWFDVPFQ
jgi:hypothetical protein